MDKKLRERLVGSVVLVSLAVIFLPELLRPPEELSTAVIDSSVPPVPGYPRLKQPPAPLPLDRLADVAGDTNPAASPSDADDIVGGDVLEIPSDLHGWVVQVGTFAERANALKLRDELRAQGYAGYVEAVSGQNRTLYRVRVGPELEKSRAQSSLARIREAFGLEPRLRRHP